MGNDNKAVRSKISEWQFFVKTYGLFYITLVAPCWLSAQAVQEYIENQLILCEVCSISLFYRLKLQLILLLTVLLSVPINDLSYQNPSIRGVWSTRLLERVSIISAMWWLKADPNYKTKLLSVLLWIFLGLI